MPTTPPINDTIKTLNTLTRENAQRIEHIKRLFSALVRTYRM